MLTYELAASLISAMQDGFSVLDQNGVQVDVNPAFCRMTGFSREELVGANAPFPFWPPEEYENIRAAFAETLRGEVRTFELKFLRKNGERFPVLVSPFPVKDSNGKTVKYAATVKDMTERKLAEHVIARANQALRMRSEASLALVHMKDEAALLTEICRIVVEVGGFRMAWVGFAEQDEAKSVRPVAQFGFEEGYLSKIEITWGNVESGNGPVGKAIRTGKPSIVRNVEEDPDFAFWRREAGQRGYRASIGVPLLIEGRMLGALAVYSDTIDPFNTQEVETLQEMAADIGSGITILRMRAKREQDEKALIAAKEAAEDALRIKSLFLDTAAHELKTPVTAFSLLLQFAQRQLERGKPLNAEILSQLRGPADRLSRLVVELLNVSRLERGLVVLNPVVTDMASLVSDCILEFRAQAPDREFVFEKPQEPVEIRVDPVRINQVLSNLLDNAVKYTPPDTPIEVVLESFEEKIRISVIDHGEGIPKGEQERLFSPFARGSTDATIRSGGLGLGLSVCQAVIALHGGILRLMSEMGHGSVFYLELPKKGALSP